MGVKLGNGKWAIKEDKLLAYNDNSGRFFNKEFDFSRGSSATYVAKDGLIKNTTGDIPRIDFTDTSKGALLLEPQSTNLVTYSSDFNQWNANGDTVIESGYLAPDGSNTAYKVTGSTGFLNYTSISNTTQTRTIYAKTVSGTGQAHLCSFNGNTNNLFTITEQWQRFEVNGTTSSTGATSFYAVDFRGSTNLTEVIIWGAQLEDLSYATSYIPTYGSIATRNSERCNNSGSAQDFNDSEGVLYCEIAALADDETNRKIAIGSPTNRIIFGYRNGSNKVRVEIISSNSAVYDNSPTINNITTFNKFAVKYKQNDFSLWINSQKVSIDTSGNTPTGLNELAFDDGGANFFYGKVREVQVFTTALTDEQLEKLTQV